MGADLAVQRGWQNRVRQIRGWIWPVPVFNTEHYEWIINRRLPDALAAWYLCTESGIDSMYHRGMLWGLEMLHVVHLAQMLGTSLSTGYMLLLLKSLKSLDLRQSSPVPKQTQSCGLDYIPLLWLKTEMLSEKFWWRIQYSEILNWFKPSQSTSSFDRKCNLQRSPC